jgi:hypothetical protein
MLISYVKLHLLQMKRSKNRLSKSYHKGKKKVIKKLSRFLMIGKAGYLTWFK